MSDEPSNVVNLAAHRQDIIICECDGEWFTARIALTGESKVRAYAFPLVCVGCGRELPTPETTDE